MNRVPIPDHLAHLPVHRGFPVPHVASWSSEGEQVLRYDPVVGYLSVFSKGRQGRGRPLFGLFHVERQRHAVVLGRCQVCDTKLDRDGAWLPAHDRLIEGWHGKDPVFSEPPCCEPCARFAAQACPGVTGRTISLIQIWRLQPIISLVDPGAAPMAGADRFDTTDDEEARARLSRIARRGLRGVVGAAGHAKYTIADYQPHPLQVVT